ncbi:MAG: oligosaccharide flippase family protein [Gammaproteobacteria bacterium]|nr:oligosaccharide flippase family protein [Gammaproteobacteria bacterium]
MTASARYGRERIRAGLVHFLFGKGLSAIAGFALLVLLVRYLSVAEFAAYSVLQAFVEVFTALTGFGLTHVALRYIPELYAQHENRVFRRFVVGAFGLRFFLLTLATLLAWLASDDIANLFGLAAWVGVLQAYLLVVWLRVNSHFLFQMLESTLHQGWVQVAFVLPALVKVAAVGWLVYSSALTIQSVIWIEAAAETLGLVVLLSGVGRVLRNTPVDQTMQSWSIWWAKNARRLTQFGLAGYLQHLAILPYGSAPNRLVAGRYLDVASMATFGFAQSFADTLRRYLPAQLLAGLIRPVLVARFSVSRDFEKVTGMLSWVFRINTILLGSVAALLLAIGPAVVASVSGGKYGAEAAWLLLALVGVLILESHRFLIDLAIQAVERNGLLVTGNLVLAVSLVLAVLLMPLLGALAIPLAAGLGLILSNTWITHRLAKEGFSYPFGYVEFGRVLLSSSFAALVGYALQGYLHWMVNSLVVLISYVVLLVVTGAIRREDWYRLQQLKKPDAVAQNGVSPLPGHARSDSTNA